MWNPFHEHKWELVCTVDSTYVRLALRPDNLMGDPTIPDAVTNSVCMDCKKRRTRYRYWRWSEWERDGVVDCERKLISEESESRFRGGWLY